MVFVASEQSILKFWKKFFAEQFFAGLIFADFQKIAKSAKNSTPRKKRGLQYLIIMMMVMTMKMIIMVMLIMKICILILVMKKLNV